MEENDWQQITDWVTKHTACLDPSPGWTPDAAGALTRFRARIERDRRRAKWNRWPAWVTAATFVLIGICLLPAARARAQLLWQFLTVKQVAFIRVNTWPDNVPSPKVNLTGTIIPPIPARDLEQARWRVQYNPRLPGPGVLSDNPRLSTTFSVSAGFVVKVADLQLALQQVGITDAAVPPQWDGAQLALHTSAIVLAEWPDLVLAQSLPLTLTEPPGFDFPAYSALVLRVLGVGPEQAQELAARAGTVTPWLAPLERDFESSGTLEEIQLVSGPGTLLQQRTDSGAIKRTTVTWSVPDRVYVLTGSLSRELTIAAANAVR